MMSLSDLMVEFGVLFRSDESVDNGPNAEREMPEPNDNIDHRMSNRL